MGKSRNDQILSAFDGYDEGVRLLMEDAQRRAEESRLSPEEKRKLAEIRRKEAQKKQKAKEKWEQAKAQRVPVYLPTPLQETIDGIAQQEGVSRSQVITYLLFEAVERYERGEISFWGCKHPSESPRYEWLLVHPKDTERAGKVGSRKSRKSS